MGDFNTEIPIRTDSLKLNLDTRGKLLCQSLLALDLIPVNCLPLCKVTEYSNVPYNSSRETLIDYVFVSSIDLPRVQDFIIHDDHSLNVSTHRPI